MTLQERIEIALPKNWFWTLYSAIGPFRARCVVTSPDYKVHIGRDGDTIDDAIANAVEAAMGGEKE